MDLGLWNFPWIVLEAKLSWVSIKCIIAYPNEQCATMHNMFDVVFETCQKLKRGKNFSHLVNNNEIMVSLYTRRAYIQLVLKTCFKKKETLKACFLHLWLLRTIKLIWIISYIILFRCLVPILILLVIQSTIFLEHFSLT